MRLRGVRPALITVLLAVPLAGCGALGLGPDAPGGSAAPAPAAGDSWVVVAPGSPTPTATQVGRATVSPTPAPSLSPADPSCGRRPTGEPLIPLTVVSGTGSLRISWPRYGAGSSYRVAAVPQRLASGAQPAVRWQQVAPGAGCAVTTTIGGLASGAPYVVWLDAPQSGHQRDGTRNLYSGRSGLVHPR